MQQEIVNTATEFYLGSKDFNGYPVHKLRKDFNLDPDRIKNVLLELINSREIDVVFGNCHPNPHINAFSGISPEKQIEFLSQNELSDHFCLYPTNKILSQRPEIHSYHDKPFTKELALGAGQLDFRVFDISILEYYRNDPRYYYKTDFINGQISIHDEYFETESMPEHDQVLIQSFGFAYDKEINRYVAVFLRYLSGLSAEHQKLWKAKELQGEFELHPDYLRNSMGHWGTKISIFEAFIQELSIINEMSSLMKKPNLFRNSHKDEAPRNFGFLLRPTLSEFNSFILLLDQLMSDNLNKEFFLPELDLEEDQEREDGKIIVRQKGTIALLNEWLRFHFHPADPKPVDDMIATFKKVRTLRQKPAHSIREDVFDQKYFKEQRQLVVDAYKAVRIMRLIFANHPKVKVSPPKISNFLYEGKIWDI